MKFILYILLFTMCFLSCSEQTDSVHYNIAKTQLIIDTIKLNKLDKLFVVGDFDGDGEQDTIYQHVFSRKANMDIVEAANPYENEWDTVVKWFYEQEAELYLSINKNTNDTLNLGTALGLYCLINISDNNNDGKDEIAFVIDYLDYSRVNSCKIYTLCNTKWTLLKQFAVHEDAFNFTEDKAPHFEKINEYLEKQNNKWFYRDYLQDGNERQEDVGKMMALKLEKCD